VPAWGKQAASLWAAILVLMLVLVLMCSITATMATAVLLRTHIRK
jgi:hypothetical protein